MADGRDETDKERLDRNLGELLQKVRVALPGVQVLLGTRATVVATAATLAAFAGVGYGLPLHRRERIDQR